MTVQSYLHSATGANLPPIIEQNKQYATLVTQYCDWQQDLWAQFWEGLLSDGIMAESNEVNLLFTDGVSSESAMKNVFYDGVLAIVVAQCADVANFVTTGQTLLQQLEQIAGTIENADKEAVAALTSLVGQLQDQFNAQEDELTHDALSSATDMVAIAVDVALAIGTEGDAIEPLVKGVIKLGSDAVTELALTSEINQTLKSLESAWMALDKATTNLAQITLTCNQLKAVTDQASATLTALQALSNDWNSVATSTGQSKADWISGGSAALQQWAALMVKMKFGTATQQISTSAIG